MKYGQVSLYNSTNSLMSYFARILVYSLVVILMFSTLIFADSVDNTKEYVILLHGLGRTAKSMSKIEFELKKSGYIVKNIGYPSRKHTIETLVEKYVRPVVKECSGAKSIHFVTHSLGGILMRYYLDKYPLQNLGKVVMLSPPNGGSEIVDKLGAFFLYKWWLGPAFQQLSTKPNSIPNKLQVPNFNLGIITGSKSTNPFFSYLIPGEDDGKVSIESAFIKGVPFKKIHVTHTWIMKNNSVIKEIVYFLKFNSFSDSSGKSYFVE
jgi:triacylglycerol lipase